SLQDVPERNVSENHCPVRLVASRETGIGRVSQRRTVAGDSSICLRSARPRVSVGVARPKLRARTVARVPSRITQDRACFSRPSPGGLAMPTAAPAFVGIDVAKAELVIAIRPSGERWTL